MVHHANTSKIVVQHTDFGRTYRAIEEYDEERNLDRPIDRIFASATPMEHIMTKHITHNSTMNK